MADEQFGIEVVIDPSAAKRGADAVDRALDGLEKQAKATSAVMSTSMGDAMRKTAREAAQAHREAARAVADSARQAALAQGKSAKDAAAAARQAAKDEVAAWRAAHKAIADSARQAAREQAAAARQANTSKAASLIGLPGGGGGGAGAGAAAMGAGRAALGAVGGAFAAKELAGVADEWINAENRMRQVTKTAGELAFVQEYLFQSAQRTGTAFNEHVALYQKVGKAALGMGKSQEEAIKLTETIAMAMKASGADGASAAAAMQQLGQALDSGVLRGEEFNSMAEQSPVIIDMIAKSMGGAREQMRGLADSGAITREVLIKAFTDGGAAARENFEKRLPTISEQWVRFRNEAVKTFGELAKNQNVAKMFGAVMGEIADVMKTVASIIGMVAGGFSKLGHVFDGLPLDKIKEVAKYLNPIGLGGKVALDLYNRFNGEDQIAADTGFIDPLGLKGSEGNSSQTESRNVDAGRLMEETQRRFDEQKKMLAKRVKSYRSSLGLGGSEKKTTPEEGEHWIDIYDSMADTLSMLGGEAIAAGEAVHAHMAKQKEAAEVATAARKEQLAATLELWEAQQGLRELEAELLKEQAEKMAAPMKALQDSMKNELAGAFDEALRSALNFENGFKAIAQNLLREIAVLIAKMLLLKAIEHGFGGAGGLSSTGKFLSNLVDGGNRAGGGTYVTPGSGGVDSQWTTFRTTPGERITFTPPGGMGPSGGGGSSAGGAAPVSVPLSIHLGGDLNSLVTRQLSSPAGEQIVIDIVAKHAGKLRGALAR